MKQINIYYNKFRILRIILQPYLMLFVLDWAMNRYIRIDISDLFKGLPELWQMLTQWHLFFTILLILLILIITSPFYRELSHLPKLLNNKPQIIINSQNIYGNLEKESMSWDNIASFEFIRQQWRMTALKLNYRPSEKHQVPAKNLYLSLENLSFDEKKLSQLFTQLIAAKDEKQRQEHINYFLSIPK